MRIIRYVDCCEISRVYLFQFLFYVCQLAICWFVEYFWRVVLSAHAHHDLVAFLPISGVFAVPVDVVYIVRWFTAEYTEFFVSFLCKCKLFLPVPN